MTVPLPLQPRTPLRGGLASVAQPVPLPESDWRGGVFYTPQVAGTAFRWGCAVDAETLKDVSDTPGSELFDSTTIGVLYECGPGARNTSIGDILEASAVSDFRAQRWSEAARLLQDGVVYSGENAGGLNPGLKDATLAPLFVEAANGTLREAVAQVLQISCACLRSDPVLHVPRQYLPHFLAEALVQWDPARSLYHMGPIDVSFDCYANEGTAAVEAGGNPTAADGSEVWIWATSRPLVSWSSEEIVGTVHAQRNENYVRVEQGVIAMIDPDCIYAARAAL